VDLANCTIYGGTYGLRAIIDNEGYGGGTANVKNLIIWGTSAPSVLTDTASTVNATYCDFEDPYAGAGNISADPLFADPASGDFHLSAFSPCIDSGSSLWPAPPTDIDGDHRMDHPDVPNTGGGPVDYFDMGIDEYIEGIVNVVVPEASPPARLEVLPNPAGAGTRVRFRLSAPGSVSMRLFDAAGRFRLEEVVGPLPEGEHTLRMPGGRLSPGVYFLDVGDAGTIGRVKFVVVR
jgi:hypothetical protein